MEFERKSNRGKLKNRRRGDPSGVALGIYHCRPLYATQVMEEMVKISNILNFCYLFQMSICIYQLLCFCWPKKKKMSSQMLIKSFVGTKGVANKEGIRAFFNPDNKRLDVSYFSLVIVYIIFILFYFKVFCV